MREKLLKPKSSKKILEEIDERSPAVSFFQCIKNNFQEGILHIYNKSPEIIKIYSGQALRSSPFNVTVDTLNLLRRLGYEFTQEDKDNLLLIYSMRESHKDRVQYIVSLGANPNYYNEISNRTPLSYAAEHGILETTKFLVDVGAKINYRNSLAFQWACLGGYLGIIRYFVEERNFDIMRYYDDTVSNQLKDMGRYKVAGYLDEKINELKSIDI